MLGGPQPNRVGLTQSWAGGNTSETNQNLYKIKSTGTKFVPLRFQTEKSYKF